MLPSLQGITLLVLSCIPTAGQLGTGDMVSSAVPTAVAGGHRWLQLSAGGKHTCGIAITDDGLTECWCWGSNRAGQLVSKCWGCARESYT